ncbi:hypothetical protein ICA16_17335 [Pseudomonas anatoliensis]|uniref:hypothetical protein n=1 Tax=Pseudomonas anatoliensis TaxID=2710589 RepID=UPI001B32B99C|nr:hypothetical protein [Pseudomonas anatoliensis]MBP5957439.1 hypothetical protein [Pseudomonas anatoliensis]
MVDEYLTMVVGNSIVLVPEVDGAAAYDDLINSILLAQLVANKKIEKTPEIVWYDACMEVLDAYWLRQKKSNQTWEFSYNAEGLVPDVFTAMLTYGALGDAHTTAAVLARVARLPDKEPALQLLRSHMQPLVEPKPTAVPEPLMDVRLLVIVAKSPNSITSAYVEFKTRQVLSPNPFQQSYQADDLHGLVHVHHACANLIEQLYGPVRAATALKVRDRLARNVATLPLPTEVESCRLR